MASRGVLWVWALPLFTTQLGQRGSCCAFLCASEYPCLLLIGRIKSPQNKKKEGIFSIDRFPRSWTRTCRRTNSRRPRSSRRFRAPGPCSRTARPPSLASPTKVGQRGGLSRPLMFSCVAAVYPMLVSVWAPGTDTTPVPWESRINA